VKAASGFHASRLASYFTRNRRHLTSQEKPAIWLTLAVRNGPLTGKGASVSELGPALADIDIW
jgi:hypothetical protein